MNAGQAINVLADIAESGTRERGIYPDEGIFAHIDRLTAENKRLREALEEISETIPFTHEDGEYMQSVAMEALNA